jgi:hypothetical protein
MTSGIYALHDSDGKLTSEERWVDRLRKLEAHEAWTKVPPEKPYGSLEALLKAEIGTGVEESIKVVKLRRRGRPTLQETDKGNNVTLKMRGNYAEYLAARIARDRPDILERMKAGEFSSVRQAAKEAGIVNERLSVPADPIRAAQYLKRRFTKTEFDAFKKELLA